MSDTTKPGLRFYPDGTFEIVGETKLERIVQFGGQTRATVHQESEPDLKDVFVVDNTWPDTESDSSDLES